MTLLLGSFTKQEAFWGTDTLTHYPDGTLANKRKYRIFSELSLSIFPRGSDILTSIWMDNLKSYLGSQTLSDFLTETGSYISES